MNALAPSDLDRIFREESGRVVATLVRLFGDIDIAEEMVQEAFVIASERWPETGLPPNPGGWITTTARNRAIDRLRREASRDDRQAQAALLHESTERLEPESDVKDDRLRLIFTCCHPALGGRARRSRSRCDSSAASRRRTSHARSSCPSPRWPSASCAPSRRSATRRSRTAFPATPSSPAGSARCSR